MRKITPMRRITIILNILTLRGIRQTELQLPVVDDGTPLHPGGGRPNASEFIELLGATLARPRSRQEAVRLAVQDTADGRAGVVAGRD